MTHIFDVIRRYHMIEGGMRVIAGVSGGADSVYLLQVLKAYQQEMPFELLVVHVEHGLRGEESLSDADFVKELCEREGIPCLVVPARVRERASLEGLSLEEAGRAERYRIFEEIRRKWDAQRIAVAHNQNDQAETVLWNLVRGSGLKGLGGIRPVQGAVIRPLLFTPREKIEEALRLSGQSWRTDCTNLEMDYTRNRIRLSLLPEMEQNLNRQSTRHIAEAAARLQEVQAYLERQTDEAALRCLRGDCVLLPPFKKEESLIREELLKRMIQRCGSMQNVGSVHLRMLEQLADRSCGKRVDLPGGVCAVREDGVIRFESRKEKQSDVRPACRGGSAALAVDLPVPGSAGFRNYTVVTELAENTPDLKKQILKEKKYTKWISYDTMKGRLQLRTRKAGDYLVINAQGGTRKLKDYLIDQKIPQEKRDQILLIAEGSHILWAVGYRISEAAKVTPETKQIVKIQVLEGEKE